MSFILEALRKSEQERQRNQSPGMADLYARNRASGRRYWLPLVIVLIGLNIGLLLFLWVNGTPPPNAPAAAIPAETAALAAAPVEQPVTDPATASAADTAPAAVTPPPAAVETAPASQAERELASELVPRPAARTVSSPAITGAGENSAGIPQSNSYGNLPTLEELTLAGTISLNPLRIDMHVFSPQPAERFVFINMNKYREGDSLREGPALKAITEDGVILNHQGRTFLVTRE